MVEIAILGQILATKLNMQDFFLSGLYISELGMVITDTTD